MNITQIGPYEITHKLGEGGMGSVYAARHRSIERDVAIKFLSPHCIMNIDLVQRFLNEARAAARIDHPGIIQILDSGTLADGVPYLVMELLKGESLASRINRIRLTKLQFLRIGWQIASAVAAAHAVGIIHRDLKPDNIMLVPDPLLEGGERVKILDFGIAKLSQSTHAQTRSNVLMGTPRYMSPEQCRGAAAVDSRSDVYSFGVILYEVITGRAPFQAESSNDYLFRHVIDEPLRIETLAPNTPASIAILVHRLLVKDPRRRPAMPQVAAELHELLATLPPSHSAITEAPLSAPPKASASRKSVVTTLGQTTGLRLPKALGSRGWAYIVIVSSVLAIGATLRSSQFWKSRQRMATTIPENGTGMMQRSPALAQPRQAPPDMTAPELEKTAIPPQPLFGDPAAHVLKSDNKGRRAGHAAVAARPSSSRPVEKLEKRRDALTPPPSRVQKLESARPVRTLEDLLAE